MTLTIVYDREVDILRAMTGESDNEMTCAHLEDDVGVLVGLDDDGGTHVVSLEIMGASAYLPLGKRGYDPDADTLTLGEADVSHSTENGDIVTYWRETPDMDLIGVTLRRASTHMNGVSIADEAGNDRIR